ncbi:MAG TPA: GLPGLI family protein [Mucilaginibacter sp.]|nr:GLPGLI family protein [Mucilaginibacter sp.]
MKRALTVSTMLVFAVIGAFAQKPDTAQILVHYKFSQVRDTNNRAHPYTENMVLFVGKASGCYRSYDRQLQNELYRRQMQEAINNSPDGNIRLDHKITASGTEYYQFINNKKLVRREVMMNAYIVNEVLPVITWHISADRANFAELHCQKATCHFKGRDYTAWFCPDLPVRVGPWKLNGLPGVIVEAYDAKKEVVFKFDRVEKAVLGASKPIKDRHGRIVVPLDDDANGADPNIIRVPTNGIVTTEKELARLQNAMHRDPNVIVQTMKANAQSNGGPKTGIDIKVGAPPILNNPIELPEK